MKLVSNKSVRRFVRFHVVNPSRYEASRLLVRPGRQPVRVLIASDHLNYTSEQQLAPLQTYAAGLRHQLGVVSNHQLIDDVLKSPQRVLSRYELILAKLSFRLSAQEAQQRIRALWQGRGNARLIYCDGDDDPCVQWPEILPWVDLYLKKHMFADPAMYGADLLGKTNLTDYVIRRHGISIDGDPRQHAGVVPPEHRGKIAVGWNIGLDDKIQNVWRESRTQAATPRTYDIVCRAGIPSDWIRPLREPINAILSRMSDRCRVLLPTQRVAPPQYYQELRSAKMCVSPFGYGEICWRDFESILCGTLMIKPDMSHLRTEPNIFQPYKTYVPVKWDFSDLEEVCLKWLADDAGRRRIVEQAYEFLDKIYSTRWFIDRFAGVLNRVGIPAVLGDRRASPVPQRN